MEKTFVREISKGCSAKEISIDNIPPEIKDILVREGFDAKAPVIISMPFGNVFFHNYTTEISTEKYLKKLLKFELEDDFPIPFDDLVTDICGYRDLDGQEREFLVAAVNRSKLQEWVRTIRDAGIDCSIVTADTCALTEITSLKSDSSSIIIYVDASRVIVAVCEKGLLTFVRHIDNNKTDETASELKRETILTMKAIYERGILPHPRILLVGSDNLVQRICEELPKVTDSAAAKLNPFDKVQMSPEHKEDNRLIIALGLALAGMDNKNKVLNFLAADKLDTEEIVKTKQNALIFATLLLAIAVLFIVNLFIQLNSLERENTRLDREVRKVFVHTFPDEKKIVNELAQANEKYDALDQEYRSVASEILDRAPTLEILQEISEKITPNQNIGVSNISMNADSVRFSATAPDLESLDNLVEKFKLVSGFNSIDIGNIDVDPASDRVRFSMSIKIGFY